MQSEKGKKTTGTTRALPHYVIPTIRVHSGPAPVRQYSCRAYKNATKLAAAGLVAPIDDGNSIHTTSLPFHARIAFRI